LLSSLGWNFAVVVLLFVAHEFVRTIAIRRCLRVNPRPPLEDMLRIRLLGEAAGALTRTGALAAEPARAWLLANRGGQAVSGYSAAVGELLANSATSAAVNVAVAGFVLLNVNLEGPIVVLAHSLAWGSLVYLGALVAIVVSRVRLLGVCARGAARLPVVGRWLRVDALKVQAMEETITSVLAERSSSLAALIVLEITAQAILVGEIYWAIRSMGISVSLTSALFIEVMTRVLTIVEFVGATEMGFAIVFTWLGLPAPIGFTLSLIKTLRSVTAAGIGIGLLAVIDQMNAARVPARRQCAPGPDGGLAAGAD
jgi:hypothetical protein